jgi:uncharacterized protein involved in outer membrane biogenesis
MEPAAPTPRSRKARRIFLVLAGTVAAYGIIGGLIAPPIAKRVIADKLGEKLGRLVVIDDLSVNPYTLNATVKGMRIMEPDRATPFASFETLDVNGSASSLYRFAPVADAVTVSGLKVNLVRDAETHYNITDIIGRFAARQDRIAAAQQERPRFSVANIRFTNARVDFDDRPKGKKHQVTDINIAIPFVSTLPAHLKEYVQPVFSATVNGSPLHVKGETLPFENSLRTHIALDLDDLEVHRYVEYAPAALPVKIDSGRLDARIAVRFTQAGSKDPSIDVAGKLTLRDLGVSSPEEGALAKVGRIEVDVASFDPLAGLGKVTSVRVADVSANRDQWKVALAEARDIGIDVAKKSVHVAALATQDGTLAVKRRADGSIELPMHGGKADAAASAEPSPWVIALDQLTLDGYKVAVADASVKPAANHRVTVAHFEAAGLSTAKGTKSTMSARLDTDKGGSIDVKSSFAIDPLALDADIDARRIDLVALRPYVEHFATVGVKSANASAKGNLKVSGAGKAMRIAYKGSAEVANVATVDTASKEDLLNWDSVRATAVGFRWGEDDPVELAVGEIAVKKIYARVVVTPDGKINLQQLKDATPEAPGAGPAAAEDLKPRNIRIDRVTFADSRLDFTDHFIKPNYNADVGGLEGSVTNLSSDPAARGVVDLKGAYDRSSPVVISGTVNPLSGSLFLDIAARGKDIELPKLSAYSSRYAGYGIKEGKLTLDVKYHVEDGKLQGRNNIFIDQLVFGDKVEGPEATQLPVLFAVNLLKDSKGAINLELPISGSLDDPQFQVSALISQVVVNLLKKAITSPFSLLTAAFGGNGGTGKDGAAGSDDLAFVEFDAGRADLGGDDTKKLDSISKALLDRPAIRIEMAPRVDAEKDMNALKRAALKARVAAAKGGAMTDEEYPRYLKLIYQREVPAKKEAAKETPKEGARETAVKEPTVAEMEVQLLERTVVGDEELRSLGTRRAEAVKGYLVGTGKLPADRVLLAASAESGGGTPHASRVDFTLR